MSQYYTINKSNRLCLKEFSRSIHPYKNFCGSYPFNSSYSNLNGSSDYFDLNYLYNYNDYECDYINNPHRICYSNNTLFAQMPVCMNCSFYGQGYFDYFCSNLRPLNYYPYESNLKYLSNCIPDTCQIKEEKLLLTDPLKNIDTEIGKDVNFSITTSLNSRNVEYVWYFNKIMLNEESAPFNNYKISFNKDSSCLKLFELTNKNEGMYTCVADNYVDKIASSAKLKLKNLKSESKLSKNVNEKKMQEIPPTNKSLTLHLDENEIIDVDKTVSRENYFNENYKNKLQQDDEQSDTFLSHKTDESLTTLVEKNSNIQDKEIIFEKDRCEHEIEKCTKNLDVNIENDANLETDATKFLDESFDKILNEMPIYDHFNPNCYLSAPFHNGALNGDLQSTESDQYDMHHVEASMNHMYKDSFDMTDVNTTYASALSTITETYEDSN